MLTRTLFIAGNWKMNPNSLDDAVKLAEAVKVGVGPMGEVQVALCPPSLYLERIDRVLDGTPIGLGGQDMHAQPSGAYTGSISGPMLVDAGCTHVILGHSERRHGLGETSELINKKLHAALAAQLLPIVCIGETLDEHKAHRAEAVVREQLTGSLAGIAPEQMGRIVLAYEPVWAIGTGETATPEQAQGMHAIIRADLEQQFGAAIARRVVIQYGGSVKADNARELLAQPDIDGALVGGASLKPEEFLGIIAAARAVTAEGKAA